MGKCYVGADAIPRRVCCLSAWCSTSAGWCWGKHASRVEDGEIGALLELLRVVPVAGRVLTLDAGLLQHGLTRVVPRQGGAYLGGVKHNHREIKAAVASWIIERGNAVALADRRAADATTIEKTRGRVEERAVWVVAADELNDYVAHEYGWWHV